MSYTVEVVDDCGENHGPSSDERVVAAVCLWILESNETDCSSREARGKTRVSATLLKDRTGSGVVPLRICGIVRGVWWIEHLVDRV